MSTAVIVFPGSNCDRDAETVVESLTARSVHMVWHGDAVLPDNIDLVIIPGGFSYGDYLRCGAMSAHSPIMKEVVKFADSGGLVLGICNGFQILTECGLLPGTLMRNHNLHFLCRDVLLRVENTDTAFTSAYRHGQIINIPIAHHDGNYFIDESGLKKLEDNSQIAFRYCDEEGKADIAANPNGSVGNIAGIFNDKKNVLGMMPHPERHSSPVLGGVDGRSLFESLLISAN